MTLADAVTNGQAAGAGAGLGIVLGFIVVLLIFGGKRK